MIISCFFYGLIDFLFNVSIAAFHLPAEINVRENWVHKTQDKKKRQRKPKGQSRMDNPGKLATLGTQDTG